MRIRFPDNLAEARTFTPLHDLEEPGVCHVLFKVYRPNAEFPNGGKMSQYLETVKPGDTLTVSGPRGRHEYLGNGEFKFHWLGKTAQYSKVSFISGGTGLTPMFSILMNLKHSDPTKFTMLYANKTEADILLKSNLDAIARSGNQFKVAYTVERPGPNWQGYTGRVTAEMLKETLPAPSADHGVFICGPEPMDALVKQHLLSLGRQSYVGVCVFLPSHA